MFYFTKNVYRDPLQFQECKKNVNVPLLFANEICDFCIQVKYLLNFKCYKFCLERIPVSIQDELVTAHQYLKVMKGREPFFYFNEERNMIFLSLDNRLEPKIEARTDHIHF